MEKEKPSLSKSSFVFLAIWFCLCSLLFFPFLKVVSVSNRKNPSQKILSREAAVYGFVISYTHSVNKGRVHDYYEIKRDGSLNLYQTEFVSYGAGIPEPEEIPGAVFKVTDTGYLISELNRNMNELAMFVGDIADHSIKINKTETSEVMLNKYFAPQTSLSIKTKKINIFNYLLWRSKSKWMKTKLM